MTSVFEIETIITKWNPPFDKQTRTDIFHVKTGELFDIEDALREDVFMLEKECGNSAIIKYDPRFVLNKGIFVSNVDLIAPQTMRLHIGKPVKFSFMWGDFGVTKKITYQGMTEGTKQEEVQKTVNESINKEHKEQIKDTSQKPVKTK